MVCHLSVFLYDLSPIRFIHTVFPRIIAVHRLIALSNNRLTLVQIFEVIASLD